MADNEWLKCCVCLGKMNNPCSYASCNHMLCLRCMVGAGKACPLCREESSHAYLPPHHRLVWGMCGKEQCSHEWNRFRAGLIILRECGKLPSDPDKISIDNMITIMNAKGKVLNAALSSLNKRNKARRDAGNLRRRAKEKDAEAKESHNAFKAERAKLFD